MLLSLLDVLIGLTVVYLILSTVASLLVELIEVWLRRRGKLLANCVEEMLILGSDTGSTQDTAKALAPALHSRRKLKSQMRGSRRKLHPAVRER